MSKMTVQKLKHLIKRNEENSKIKFDNLDVKKLIYLFNYKLLIL